MNISTGFLVDDFLTSAKMSIDSRSVHDLVMIKNEASDRVDRDPHCSADCRRLENEGSNVLPAKSSHPLVKKSSDRHQVDREA